MNINLSKRALQDMAHWNKADKKTAKKIVELLKEISVTPYTGKGKPEAFRGNLSGYWSRRINVQDRIVYTVDEQAEVVYVYSLRKHYE